MAVFEAAAVMSNPVMLAGVIGAVSVLVVIMKYVSSSNGKDEKQVEQDVQTLPKLGQPPVFKDTDPDIVVVGGGITGASFVARLGMEGKKVIMIEKDMGTDQTCRGEVMLPGGIIQLEKMNMKEHMREYLTTALADGIGTVRCKRMAANFDVTPGVLIIGDALNTRHPITSSGMTVALNDVRFWWDVLVNKVNDLTDDEGILKQKLIFRKQRQKWAFSINVLAEICIRLYRDHDASTIKLQQYFIQGLRDLEKEGTTQKEKDVVYNVFGVVDTDKDLAQKVIDDTLKGTIDHVFKTRPYFAAMWESRQIRKRWQEIVSDVMSQEGMT